MGLLVVAVHVATHAVGLVLLGISPAAPIAALHLLLLIVAPAAIVFRLGGAAAAVHSVHYAVTVVVVAAAADNAILLQHVHNIADHRGKAAVRHRIDAVVVFNVVVVNGGSAAHHSAAARCWGADGDADASYGDAHLRGDAVRLLLVMVVVLVANSDRRTIVLLVLMLLLQVARRTAAHHSTAAVRACGRRSCVLGARVRGTTATVGVLLLLLGKAAVVAEATVRHWR